MCWDNFILCSVNDFEGALCPGSLEASHRQCLCTEPDELFTETERKRTTPMARTNGQTVDAGWRNFFTEFGGRRECVWIW